MTQVEHYALSIFYCGLVGVLIGVGAEASADQQEGKSKRFDILFLGGFFVSITYGFLGFKFVDGPSLIGVIGLISISVGYYVGRSLAKLRDEMSMRLILLFVLGIVPTLYHYVLT